MGWGGHSFPVGGSADWFSNSASQCGEFIKELKPNPLYDEPAIPREGHTSKELHTCHRDTCSTVFIAALIHDSSGMEITSMPLN